MISQHLNQERVTASAERLADAAAVLRRNLVQPDAIESLSATLAQIAGTVDDLAGGVTVLAETVAKASGRPGLEHLPPEARALYWHLNEFAVRLRAARASAESARSWAPGGAASRAGPYQLAGAPNE